MPPLPEVHTPIETIGLDCTTLTILIDEEPLATVDGQFDALERLIPQYGRRLFLSVMK
jgi:hypothetical protein